MKIWIVWGSTGEYSDRREWNVRAYRSKDAAERAVLWLTEKMQKLGLTEYADWDVREKASESMREHDPEFDCDYTGTRYATAEVELVE